MLKDSQLGFVFHVHKNDRRIALRLAKEIREFHPESSAICIGDGFNEPEFIEQLKTLDIRFASSREPLKTALSGWRWVQRFLINGLRLETDYFLRIDSDSRLHRRIEFVPDADMFGGLTQETIAPWPFIPGGCIGFKKEAAQKILQSKVLEDPFYSNPTYFAYPRYSNELRHRGERASRKAYYLDDIALGHIASVLGLTMAKWSEANIRFRGRPLFANKAISHPWPVAEKVFGIGLPRTGTLSLVNALQILGYAAQHWPAGKGAKTKDELLKRSRNWDALADHPVRNYYRELLELYPDARFILGDRPSGRWVASVNENFSKKEVTGIIKKHGPLLDYWEGHKAEVIQFFEKSERSGQLLIHDPADGWEPLCKFLGKPVPDEKYPHKNKKRRRVSDRLHKASKSPAQNS